jgi:hypothetical protein
MKRPAKSSPQPQMNLPLLAVPATAVPDHKQKELALTLIEILISAVRRNEITSNPRGGRHEPTEADR